VDIYSFGIILWELVTLLTPARGNLRSVRVPEECPVDVAHLIEDCLEANNPDMRPTASTIYDRLMARCCHVLIAALWPQLCSICHSSPHFKVESVKREDQPRSKKGEWLSDRRWYIEEIEAGLCCQGGVLPRTAFVTFPPKGCKM